MADTLTLTIEVLTKNAKDINQLIDRLEKLNKKTDEGIPKNDKFGSGISATTLAAGAAAAAVGLLTASVGGYVKSAISAASRTEGLRNGLKTVIPDSKEFEETLARIDKQARLPGLQKNDLLKFTASMRSAGLTGEQTERALTILGSRIVGFGQTSAEAAQVVGQFTQAMNRGKIEGDEMNRLFETLPGFKNIVIQMTGVKGGAQDLNKAFKAQGKTVQEGIIPLLEAYDKSLGGIKHDAALVKADAWEGALEDLRNTIGSKLLPTYKVLLDEGSKIVDLFSAFLSGTQSLPQPILDLKNSTDDVVKSLQPLITPLRNLGDNLLPLLVTLWKELVKTYTDFFLPALLKVQAAMAPFTAKIIELASAIIKLVNEYLPPVMTLLRGLASIIIEIVVVALKVVTTVIGGVITAITGIIEAIPTVINVLKALGSIVTDFVIFAFEGFRKVVGWVIDVHKPLISTVTFLIGILKNLGSIIVDRVVSAFKSMGRVFEIVMDRFSSLLSLIPGVSKELEKTNETSQTASKSFEDLAKSIKTLKTEEIELKKAQEEANKAVDKAREVFGKSTEGTEQFKKASETLKTALDSQKKASEELKTTQTNLQKSQTTLSKSVSDTEKKLKESQKAFENAKTGTKEAEQAAKDYKDAQNELKRAQEAVTGKTQEQIKAAEEAAKSANTLAKTSSDITKKLAGLKVALETNNIELKRAKEALKDAVTLQEIATAEKRVVDAITAVKTAKVEEAKTFDKESKKQVETLKAVATEEDELASATETATEKRNEIREAESDRIKEELDRRVKIHEQAEKDKLALVKQIEKDTLSALITRIELEDTALKTSRDNNEQAYLKHQAKLLELISNRYVEEQNQITAALKRGEISQQESITRRLQIHLKYTKNVGSINKDQIDHERKMLEAFDKEREQIEKENTRVLEEENERKLGSWKDTYDQNVANFKGSNITKEQDNERMYIATSKAALAYFEKAKELGEDEETINKERRNALQEIWAIYFKNKGKMHDKEVEKLKKVGESIDDLITKINEKDDAVGDTEETWNSFDKFVSGVLHNFGIEINDTITGIDSHETAITDSISAWELFGVASSNALNELLGKIGEANPEIATMVDGLLKFASGDLTQAVRLPLAFYQSGKEKQKERRAAEKENRDAVYDTFAKETVQHIFNRRITDAQEFTTNDTLKFLDEDTIDAQLEQLRGITDTTVIETHLDNMFANINKTLEYALRDASDEFEKALKTGENVGHYKNKLLHATNQFYDAELEAIRVREKLLGVRLFEEVKAINEARNETLNTVRLLNTSQSQGSLYSRGKEIRDNAPDYTYTNDDEVSYKQLVSQYGKTEADIVMESRSNEPVKALTEVLARNQEQINVINVGIAALDQAIGQSNDPAEIASLLQQIAERIPEKYRLLREALQVKLDAEDIEKAEYDAALKQLGIDETAELDRNAAAMLTNTLQKINVDVEGIAASISQIGTQISQTSEPDEIISLLAQLPSLIRDKYQRLRDALDTRYAAEEINVDVYNTSLKELEQSESAELEQQSDAVLAQTLGSIDDDVSLIDANIAALQLTVENTDDPEQVAGLLDAIKLLVIDKYKRLRERFDEMLAAEEISQTAFDAATTALGTAENRELAGIDAQGLTAISEAAQEQVSFINGAIGNLRTSLELTNDPAETQQILETIRVLIGARFNILRNELEAVRKTLSSEEYQQAFEGLNLAEKLAFSNLDTEVFSVISAEAQKQVDFVNGSIENLRLSIQLTDDPTERQAILDAIKILVTQRFTILRTELEKISATLSPEDYRQALTGLNLGETLALKSIDTEKFTIISAAAQEQVNFINKDIENLRTAFEFTSDPAERQAILDTIKILTQARFDILREELEEIRDRLSPEEYEQALEGLNLGETLALDKIDTEKFDVISAAAQKQVDFVNGAISNLELAFQLTDDPEEAQQILDAIKILVAKRFEILIQELKVIEDSFDDPDLFTQALTGLQLGSQVALKGIDDRSIGITLQGFTGQIGETDAEINALFDDLSEQTTASGINTAVDRLRTAITTKYDLIRESIEASADNEEEQAKQIAEVNVQKSSDLQRLGEQGLGAFDSLINTAQFLLDNATEAEFSTRREALITAINTFYDERIAFIDGLDLSDTDRENMLAVVDIQRNIALDAIPQMHESVTERLTLEKELQDDITDLRNKELDNEADRQQRLADLAEDHQDRLTDIERDGLRRREDLQRKFSRDFADGIQEEQEQIAELLSGEGFDAREIRQFLIGFEGDVRSRLEGDVENQLNEIQRERAESVIESRIERDRDLEDIGIREGRARADAETRFTASQEDINAQAEATADALTTALAPLLGTQTTLATQQQETAMREETNAARVSETAEVESNVAARRSEITVIEAMLQEKAATNIEMFGMGVERFVELYDLFLEVGNRLTLSADRLDFSAAALTQSAELWAFVLGRDLELLAPAVNASDTMFAAAATQPVSTPVPILPTAFEHQKTLLQTMRI